MQSYKSNIDLGKNNICIRLIYNQIPMDIFDKRSFSNNEVVIIYGAYCYFIDIKK